MDYINEIDQDDLEEYKDLLEERTRLEMRLIQYQKYIEDKYLAGLDLKEGEVYLDASEGILYFWLDN